MGNNAGREDMVQVVMKMHDLRRVRLKPGEVVEGTVSVMPGCQVAHLSKDTPATFSVNASSTIIVELIASLLTDEGQHVRALGQVMLPVGFLSEHDQCLYHVWFSLSAVRPRIPGQPVQPIKPPTVEEFGDVMRQIGRDPDKPVVCLSMCEESRAQEGIDRYVRSAGPAERSFRFIGLKMSQKQNQRLYHLLYRKKRRTQYGGGSELENSWSAPWHMLDNTSVIQKEEVERIREEIRSTSSEATQRVTQAHSTIEMLVDQFQKQRQHSVKVSEGVDKAREAGDALEIENQKLESQLAHQKRITSDCADEIFRLKQEEKSLKNQMEALMVIVQEMQTITDKNGAETEDEVVLKDDRTTLLHLTDILQLMLAKGPIQQIPSTIPQPTAYLDDCNKLKLTRTPSGLFSQGVLTG